MTRTCSRRLAQAAIVVVGVVVLTFAVARLVPGDPAVAVRRARARAAPSSSRCARSSGSTAGARPARRLRVAASVDRATGARRCTRAGRCSTTSPAWCRRRSSSCSARCSARAGRRRAARRCSRRAAAGSPTPLRPAARDAVRVAAGLPARARSCSSCSSSGSACFPVAGEYDPELDYTHPLTVLHAHHGRRRADQRQLADPRQRRCSTSCCRRWPSPPTRLGAIAQMTRASRARGARRGPRADGARARASPSAAIVGRLALRPALNPVVSLVALVFAYALVNTFLVEAIFNWPGLGSYAVDSIQALDTPAIIGVTLLVALALRARQPARRPRAGLARPAGRGCDERRADRADRGAAAHAGAAGPRAAARGSRGRRCAPTR